MADKQQQNKARPGPEPERLKIDGDWDGAVGKALRKKRPKKPIPAKKKVADS